ncbi:hypothetical protein GOP47_0029853 [Adiantum capillus-veneris]|nr:hypothetical protein GOP47_0029853 [Adiantum capillus-veneris]
MGDTIREDREEPQHQVAVPLALASRGEHLKPLQEPVSPTHLAYHLEGLEEQHQVEQMMEAFALLHLDRH